ncbi:hypothetical protein [Halolamina rubra]|uniref:hypothetical protein n=1 Tax=Halolamina rubra TaxID=1380430 RepID=UPI000679C1B7|nr:hypothetical protein [Halolamina rubra]
MWSPKRHAALAVCVALLLITAGCSGVTPRTDSSTGTATATPTASWAPDASVDQYPPGVAANGTLTNVTALLDAHFAATATQPMALTHEWTAPNESGVRRYAHGADSTPYYSAFNRTVDGDRTTEQFYWTGSHGYSRVTFDDQTRFSVFQNATGGVDAWTHDDVFGKRSTLRTALVGGNYSVNGTVERGDRTFVRLKADEVSPSRTTIYEAYQGTVLVTPEGVVYDVDTSLVGTSNATNERLESSISLDTDVDWSGAPPWVADLPHLSIATVENGHALEIRNAGETALPANASFTVSVSNETVWGSPLHGDATGTVTTSERLEPGDSVYVTVGRDGNPSSFALHRERARGEYTIVAAGVRGAHDGVSYRLETGSKSD